MPWVIARPFNSGIARPVNVPVLRIVSGHRIPMRRMVMLTQTQSIQKLCHILGKKRAEKLLDCNWNVTGM